MKPRCIAQCQDLASSGTVSLPQVPQFSSGDVVRILDDIATVHNLQEGHGGWVDDMALVSSIFVHRKIEIEDILIAWHYTVSKD